MNAPLHSPDRPRTATPADDHRPVVAVTMGDGAGVGPEVVMAALGHPDIVNGCRPLVIGDARRLREAAALVGSGDTVVTVSGPGDADWTPGRVNVVDLDLLPMRPAVGTARPGGGRGRLPLRGGGRAAGAGRRRRRHLHGSPQQGGPAAHAATSTPDTPNCSRG